MNMAKRVAGVMGKGIRPQAFVDGMQKNKEAFVSWYDQFAWADEEDKSFFESLQYRDDLRCLILAADWCGDVVRNVPVVFRAMEAAQIETEVLIMEQFRRRWIISLRWAGVRCRLSSSRIPAGMFSASGDRARAMCRRI